MVFFLWLIMSTVLPSQHNQWKCTLRRYFTFFVLNHKHQVNFIGWHISFWTSHIHLFYNHIYSGCSLDIISLKIGGDIRASGSKIWGVEMKNAFSHLTGRRTPGHWHRASQLIPQWPFEVGVFIPFVSMGNPRQRQTQWYAHSCRVRKHHAWTGVWDAESCPLLCTCCLREY